MQMMELHLYLPSSTVSDQLHHSAEDNKCSIFSLVLYLFGTKVVNIIFVQIELGIWRFYLPSGTFLAPQQSDGWLLFTSRDHCETEKLKQAEKEQSWICPMDISSHHSQSTVPYRF